MSNPESSIPEQGESSLRDDLSLQLLHEELSYVEALNALPDPFFLCTPEGKVVFWNRRAREVAGFSDDEPALTDITDPVPEGVQSLLLEKLGQVVETGSARLEVPVVTGSGGVVPFEVTGSLIRQEGQPLICAIARDITERKAREEKLKRREEQFRLLVEGVKEYAIFRLDPEGHITTWNDGAEKIKGYTEEEILGEHFSVFYPKNDVEAGKPEEALAIAAENGQRIDEGWRVRKDGSRFWARTTTTALHSERGRVRGFTRVTRDMTERRKREEALRESERKYRRLFEESRDAIVLTTPSGAIVDVNHAAEELFGYSEETLLHMDASELYAHPEERRQRILPELLDGDGSSRKLEAQMRHKDGHTFLASASMTIHRSESGESELIHALVRDITEYRQLQRDVLRTQEEERRRMGQDLHDGVASQLTGISLILETATELLDEDHPAHSRIEQAQVLVQESGEDVRRLSRGLSPISFSEMGLPAALERLAENTESCRFEQEGDGDLSALSDEKQAHLYWIAQEAVTNARKYAEADEIVVRTSSTDDEDLLVVEDDGKGFDPSAKDKDEGLGLRTMRYRAELLGEEFAIESTPGEGTRVECRVRPGGTSYES